MLKTRPIDVTETFDALFISDLHLHPDDKDIQARFQGFLNWALHKTKTLYILGDFFHVWAGDDDLSAWSLDIAGSLKHLADSGIDIYFMAGNRDFLIGKKFAKYAGFSLLHEPHLIELDEKVLLVHGDSYCTKDRQHYWFRKLTRNRYFPKLFLMLPLSLRKKLVAEVRQRSQSNRNKDYAILDVVPEVMLPEMKKKSANILIHGHTHKPMLRNYDYNDRKYTEYVLSDWDNDPPILCYKKGKGFFFIDQLGAKDGSKNV